jgi:putative flavoprotein involved in K+ transport
VVDWLADLGYYDMPVHEHPQKERVRIKANHYVTGRDGGRDIDLRKFANEGMQLHGRLRNVQGSKLTFADDLEQNLDQADNVAESIKNTIDKFIAEKAVDAPPEPRYVAVWRPENLALELDYAAAGITSVIWSAGFRTDYSWVEIPLFDGKGYPVHQRGVTSIPGLYFLGLPWLYTWGSGRFSGIARDAQFLADCIEARHNAGHPPAAPSLNELALGS